MNCPKIVEDTLMKDGKWSRTSLTMFIGYCMANYMAVVDLYKHGFNFEVFLTYIGVAGGMKVVDAFSKKLGKDANTTTTT